MPKYWIAVASREHVKRGVKERIAQVCHGKCSPLNRMKAGDWIVYYSPVEHFGKKEPCQQFTAIGTINEGEPYRYRMSDDFIPWRRDVSFVACNDAPIKPLIEKLTFIKNKRQWGFPFRRGCFSITADDFNVIAHAMGVDSEAAN